MQAALGAASPVAPPPSPVTPDPPGDATPDPAPDSPLLLDVRPAFAPVPGPTLRSAWVRREGSGRRALFVQIQSHAPVETDIGLTAHGPSSVQRRLRSVGGRQTIRVPLAAGVAHGPARLHVRFRDVNGRTRHATRLVSIPARHPRPR